jgi:hypothetical protein
LMGEGEDENFWGYKVQRTDREHVTSGTHL